VGKDERALSVSSYVYRESVKYTDYAFDKTTVHKHKSRKAARATGAPGDAK